MLSLKPEIAPCVDRMPEPKFSEMFLSYILARNARVEGGARRAGRARLFGVPLSPTLQLGHRNSAQTAEPTRV